MANVRQLKLGAVLVGVGNDQLGWRDPEVPSDASVDVGWFIENARLAEESKFDFVFIVDSPYSSGRDPATRTCFDRDRS